MTNSMRRFSLLGLLAAFFLLIGGITLADEPQGDRRHDRHPPLSEPVEPAPIADFQIRNIQGFTVYVNKKDLAEQPEGMADVLKHMKSQLYQTRVTLPAPAVAIMQERVPIWVEWSNGSGIAFHPHASWLLDRGFRSPEGVKSTVGFGDSRGLCRGSYHQPWVACHELAHGYDYLYLGRGRSYSNDRLRQAYRRLRESGIYDAVLCRYSPATDHYALSNPMEYLAESTEAYFGANDFYPFVRAELKDYDPEMYDLLQDLWGVDVKRQNRDERELAERVDAWIESNYPTPEVEQGEYQSREIEGWTVEVATDLVRRQARGDALCELLWHKLHLVTRYLPEASLTKLREIPIRLEAEPDTAVYPYIFYQPPRDGDGKGIVEIADPNSFERWQAIQTGELLKQLALAYYELHLTDEDRDRIEESLHAAIEKGTYDEVLRFDGRKVRHPALADPAAYFAELTVAYYGVSDHFPFIQFETRKHDADICRLLSELWGGRAK